MIINKKYANYKRVIRYLSMFTKKNRTFLILIISILLLIVLLLWRFGSGIFNMDAISTFIKSFGKLGALIFVLFFNFKTILVVFPYSIFVLIGGTLFGSVYGILLSTLCVATSSTIAFWISRHLGKDKMKRLLKGRFSMLDEKTAESGFNIIFFMRLSCLFPADAFSYAAGLTQIKYTHFIAATVIGMLPEVISMSMLGENIKNPMSKEFWVSIGLVVITATLSIVIQKLIKISKEQGA